MYGFNPVLNLVKDLILISRYLTSKHLVLEPHKGFPTIHQSLSYPAIDRSLTPQIIHRLITGGSSGIGPHITHALLPNMGLSRYLVIIGRTSSSLSLPPRKRSRFKHSRVSILALRTDILDKVIVNQVFETTRSTFGPIDILVANAGYLIYQISFLSRAALTSMDS